MIVVSRSAAALAYRDRDASSRTFATFRSSSGDFDPAEV